MQGRVFSARNTLQYTSIPLGNLTAGFLADKVFEPYMHRVSAGKLFFEKVVGSGNGSGIALLYLCIAAAGVLGCFVFRMNKDMKRLDEN